MAIINFEIVNNVAYIALNRPEVYNSFNTEMALLLQELLGKCTQDDDVRAVYLTGVGKAFSAGQDIGELTGSDAPSMQTILQKHYNPIVWAIRQMPKPVVAAVNGVAAGAGANIALACDVVVAAERASFIQAFSKIGLIPDSGGTFVLPRLVGWGRASALMMLGDKVTAQEAAQFGMIYKVLGDDAFETESKKIAETLAKMPTHGLALTKQALNQSSSNDLNQQLALEDTLQQQAAKSRDYAEGIDAFLGKRPPKFIGK